MKLYGWFLAIALVIVLPMTGVSGEYYQYEDSDGNVRFTDDISQVPEGALPEVQAFNEVESYDPAPAFVPEEDADEGETAEEVGFSGEMAFDEPDSQNADGAEGITAEELDREKEGLDRKLQALQAEKAELERRSTRDMGRNERNAYEQETMEFNARLEQFEKHREAFQVRVKQYNEGLQSK